MLVEVSVVPLGGDVHLADAIAEVLKIVEASGLAYQLNPAGTCIEGEWDEVMPLLKRCHDRVRTMVPRVLWTIKVDDEDNTHDKLTRNVISVEEKVGRPLSRS